MKFDSVINIVLCELVYKLLQLELSFCHQLSQYHCVKHFSYFHQTILMNHCHIADIKSPSTNYCLQNSSMMICWSNNHYRNSRPIHIPNVLQLKYQSHYAFQQIFQFFLLKLLYYSNKIILFMNFLQHQSPSENANW